MYPASELDLSLFHELLESSEEGAFLLDAAYSVVYANSAGVRLSHARAVAGTTFCHLFPCASVAPPSEWTKWIPEWSQHLRFRLRRRQDGYFVVWVSDVTFLEESRDAVAVKKFAEELRSSKERAWFALEAASLGVFSRSLLTGEVYLSPRGREQLGFPPEKPLHFTDIRNVIHPDDFPRMLLGIQQAVVEHAAYCNEYRVVWPDGSHHWVSVTGRASYDADDQPRELHGVLLDITPRKAIEQALQNSTNALRTVLNASPLAIFNLDMQGNVQGWNSAAEHIFGWTDAEVIGQPLPFLLPKTLQDTAWISSGETVSAIESLALRKSGAQILISVSAAPLRDAAGVPNGSVYVVDDITDRRSMEQRLQHSQKLESLGVLAGGIAHDFNNLLTGILGNASLVLDVIADDDPNRPMLNDVVRASERAANLTRQLLAYAGKGRFVTQPVQLSQLITEINSLMQSSIPKKVHLIRDLPTDSPLIEGDPSQIQQIVMNLVINAAEAIGEDIPGAILVSTRVVEAGPEYARDYFNGEAITAGKYILLEVHDTGSGMDDATQARIFDPFFSTKFTGRGLGLSAVLGIVRSHRGALRVTSSVGQGTSFAILFPVTDTLSDQWESEGNRKQPILVMAEDTREQLEKLGYPVVAAKDGEAATHLLKEERHGIALLLIDPERHEAFLGHLHSLKFSGPVLLSTTLPETVALRQFHQYRPAGIVQMPYTPEDFHRKLRSILQLWNAPDQSGTST